MNIMCYYSPIEGPNPSPKATIDPIKPKALPFFLVIFLATTTIISEGNAADPTPCTNLPKIKIKSDCDQ